MSIIDKLRELGANIHGIVGVHSFYTKTMDKPCLYDYEIATMIAGINSWRRFNHRAHLYTDKKGRELLTSLGLIKLYDEVYDLGDLDPAINSKLFWAAGKIQMMKQAKTPFVSIDLDLVPWIKPEFNFNAGIEGLHVDNPSWPAYTTDRLRYAKVACSVSDLTLQDFDDVLPLNAAMLAIYDEAVKRYFTDISLAFMAAYSKEAHPGPADDSGPMVFAEQLLAAVCAKKLGHTSGVFFPRPANHKHHIAECLAYTHLWGGKHVFKRHASYKRQHIIDLITKLQTERFIESVDAIVELGLDKFIGEDTGNSGHYFTSDGWGTYYGEAAQTVTADAGTVAAEDVSSVWQHQLNT